MTRTIYALLVGIDDYQPPVRPLNGCVNDIRRVEALLRTRVNGENDRFEPRVLTDAQATRQGIIDAFRSHLGQAGAGDVALFYYSGHGSQAPSPEEFWHLEPDRLDETLVCYDSRNEGSWDLADKELARLIAEVAEKDAHVLVILDCCHSGSGTRAPEVEESVRRVPTDVRQRPFDTFIVSPEAATALAGNGTRSIETGSGWTLLPRGRHVVFSACRAEEEAKELYLGGESRGVFSYFLLETLQRTGQSLTYRDLFKRISALVRSKVARQAPLLEATASTDLDQPFLGGAIAPRAPYFTLSHDQDMGWIIDGGAVHGIPAVQGEETTYLSLFPFDAALGELKSLAGATGEARVTSTLAHASRVDVSLFDGEPDPAQTYKAVVTALPLPPLQVHVEGEGDAADRVRAALAAAGPGQQRSLLVAETQTRTEAELRLLVRDEGYRIVRVGDSYPLAVDVPGSDAAAAALAIARLEHIARWMRLADLANQTSRIDAGAVRVQFYRVETDDRLVELAAPEGSMRLAYAYADGQWREPRFKIKVTNTSDRRLYCALFDLTEEYEIIADILPGAGVWLDPGQETWALGGEPLYGEVPRRLWEQGVVETHDLAKLIVSTDEFDATLMAQDPLPVDVNRSGHTPKAPGHLNTLNRLMGRVNTRAFRHRPERAEDYVDWTASEVSVTFVRPQEAVDVAAEGRSVSLGAGVTLAGHPSLKAKARLISAVETGRSLGNLTLPPILREDPSVSQPFQFSVSRSGEPGLSALELFDVENYTAVTPEQPLVLRAGVPLAPHEHVLPVAYDGEFFLPLGAVRHDETGATIRLDRLPTPTVAGGKRDLKGSIRILFQKIAGERLGLGYTYPILAATALATDGALVVEANLDAVRARVAEADRIVLVVHGIIGDTRGMATTALRHVQPPAGARPLVLSFDYENINTTIEETARALKGRLEAVGLDANHDKHLTIVAHSMGGLVSRWFIEHEGGHRVVQHLVMCGTPNAGSPWPSVQAWATTALGIGLNTLSTVAWPVKALGSLLGAIEAVDVTLDQMQPGSDILKTLAESPDPGVRYTVLAGNTALVPAALHPPADASQSRIERLLGRLSPQKLLHGVTALAFFGQPNDIAVSVESIESVALDRSPQPNVEEVACDHLTYFSSEAGLRALSQTLSSAQRTSL